MDKQVLKTRPKKSQPFSGKRQCHSVTESQITVILKLKSRKSIEGQQTTDNARANERNKSSLLISQRRRDMLASVATVARYESATCDEGRFISPEECALAPLDLFSRGVATLSLYSRASTKLTVNRQRTTVNGQCCEQ